MYSGNSNRKDVQNTGRTFLPWKMYFTDNNTSHLYSTFHPKPLYILYPSWNHISHYWTAPTLVCKWRADIFCPVRCGSCLDFYEIVYLYKVVYSPISTMPFSHHCRDQHHSDMPGTDTIVLGSPAVPKYSAPWQMSLTGRKNGEGQLNL